MGARRQRRGSHSHRPRMIPLAWSGSAPAVTTSNFRNATSQTYVEPASFVSRMRWLSGVSVSLLIVLFYALGHGSGEAEGRMRWQYGGMPHKLLMNCLFHICAGHSKFQPITRDLERLRKMHNFALSRRQRGFESRWGHKFEPTLTRSNASFSCAACTT